MSSVKMRAFVTSVGAAALLSAASTSQAWTATNTGSFKSITSDGQCGQGTITGSGGTFNFNKPNGANRCEAKGAKGINPTQGRTYTISWNFRLNNTVNNNAIFQWKSYGSPMTQNFPLVLKVISNALVLQYTPPGGNSVQPTRTAISKNTTYSVRLQIRVSNSASTGWVSYWLNGAQRLNQYKARTFDGSSVEPKWGIYGASGAQVTDTVTNLTMN
jgi:hypothetical protein